jgi:hypothetical protein
MPCETEGARNFGHKEKAVSQINGTKQSQPEKEKAPKRWKEEKIKGEVKIEKDSKERIGNSPEFGPRSLKHCDARLLLQPADLGDPKHIWGEPLEIDAGEIDRNPESNSAENKNQDGRHTTPASFSSGSA